MTAGWPERQYAEYERRKELRSRRLEKLEEVPVSEWGPTMLVSYFQDSFHNSGWRNVSPFHVVAMTKRFKENLLEGITAAEIKRMIELFFGDERNARIPGPTWRTFLGKRQELLVRAEHDVIAASYEDRPAYIDPYFLENA